MEMTCKENVGTPVDRVVVAVEVGKWWRRLNEIT